MGVCLKKTYLWGMHCKIHSQFFQVKKHLYFPNARHVAIYSQYLLLYFISPHLPQILNLTRPSDFLHHFIQTRRYQNQCCEFCGKYWNIWSNILSFPLRLSATWGTQGKQLIAVLLVCTTHKRLARERNGTGKLVCGAVLAYLLTLHFVATLP